MGLHEAVGFEAVGIYRGVGFKLGRWHDVFVSRYGPVSSSTNVQAYRDDPDASLVLSLFPLSHEARSAMVAIGGVLYAAWIVGYFVVFWTTTGETPGNRVMRIRVVCARGGTLRPFRALVRLAGMVISLPFLIGFLPVLVTERRRGLPDALAGTVVLSNVEPHERTDP